MKPRSATSSSSCPCRGARTRVPRSWPTRRWFASRWPRPRTGSAAAPSRRSSWPRPCWRRSTRSARRSTPSPRWYRASRCWRPRAPPSARSPPARTAACCTASRSAKDLIDTAGLRTTYGSGMFREHVPERDGSVPERLRAAGAIITGKTATHELGQGMTTNNYFFGPTRNPWNPEHVPGGSSGGAAAAAAALMGPLHIGTDGGGSIRFPAAFCGVTGLKPTLGLISNRGQFGGAGTSFSVPGPLTRTVRDAALAAQALAGFDPEHLYSRPGPAPDLVGGLEGGVRGLRVGTSPDLLLTPPEPEV